MVEIFCLEDKCFEVSAISIEMLSNWFLELCELFWTSKVGFPVITCVLSKTKINNFYEDKLVFY